jgi:hypothetical protein
MRYKFFRKNNNIICVSSFAQKPVRAAAKCHPDDLGEFNIEYGERLAKERCDFKVATKRVKYAQKRLEAAKKAMAAAEAELRASEEYLNIAITEYEDLEKSVRNIEAEAK